jgi:hydrogenase nickel incorporation protein HypB
VNLVGSPGCGKTTFLEGLFRELGGRIRMAVIEGDVAGQVDAERMERIGVPVVQINTEGMCHLDATMIAAAGDDLSLDGLDLLLIENVGNLVCTAGFDLGEHLRLVALSTSEGDDKLVKYPAIFRGSRALLITKADLIPHCPFDPQRAALDMERLAPGAEVFQVAALEGRGMPAVAQWLLRQLEHDRRGRRQTIEPPAAPPPALPD